MAVRASWEGTAWTALMALAVASRLWSLGARAMSHDESIHAYNAFQLYDSGAYRHEPVYHGPLLYYVNAVVFWLLGASDFTARIVPALAGVTVVLMVCLFRGWLGRWGAWMGAFLIVISPTLLFYSRFLWSDIYIAVFSLLWSYGAFRYLEDRRRRWLVLVTSAMALSFVTKEVAFIFLAIIGAFCAALFVWRVVGRLEPWRASPTGDLIVLMATLVLPFTASTGHLLLGWDPGDYASRRGLLHAAALVPPLFVASAVIAVGWFGRRPSDPPRQLQPRLRDWAALMALFWGIEVVFFTTFLTNMPGGLASGIVGSLGYWLGQHPVDRGSHPWFYYVLLLALYEFLPALLCAVAAVVLWRRVRTRAWRLAAPPEAIARRAFVVFCGFWTVTSFMAYTVAGEKMPWLFIHQALPLCLLGGWGAGRVLDAIDWRTAGWRGCLAMSGGTAALVVLVAHSLGVAPFAGRDRDALAATAHWLLVVVIAGLVASVLIREGRRVGWRTGRRLAVVGLAALLALLTVRTAARLAYVNYDLATELLVFAHGTPDIKRAMAEIEQISERTAADHNLEVAYDDESTWPLVWYLREYPHARFYGTQPTAETMTAPVIIVGPKNAAKVRPYVERGYVDRSYRLVWWPIDDRASLDWRSLKAVFLDADARRRAWQIWSERRYSGLSLSEWPRVKRFTMYMNREVARQTWLTTPEPTLAGSDVLLAPVPELHWQLAGVYSGLYDRKSLRAPTAVALMEDGARVIADAGNDRIVVLNRDGTFRMAFGSTCVLAERSAGGCVVPQGAREPTLGDGQFREPWGLAVSARNEIYVADTWNGRIQVFDSRGRLLRKWGQFSSRVPADSSTELHSLYGPRGLAFDIRGRLLVADTGNKRLLRFGHEGEPLGAVGGPGAGLGRFAEPVGLAVGPPNGSVYVADTWNRRVQRLDRDLKPLAEWPIPGWRSQTALNKPYLAVDRSGLVYVGDPEHSRILVYDAQGRPAGVARIGGGAAASRPLGLAVDPGGTVLVADHANDRVLLLKADDRGGTR
jgi:uncharacterized protein (TIGR03663 family)